VDGRTPIDLIRELNEWWARRDFESTRELLLASSGWDDAAERFRQAGLQVDPIAPDVEVVVDAFPEGGTWIGQRGRDEWIRFWQEWVRPWKDFELEHSHYEQVGNHVLAEVRVRARSRETGDTVEIPAIQLFRVRNGLIDLYAVYQSRDHALAAITAE
jgi:ketosteroid isomerase-like protein